MFVKLVLATATGLAAAALVTPAAHADTLDTKAAKRHDRAMTHAGGNVPARGMTMGQVEKRFGAPVEKLAPAGGDTPRHPTINRWRYDGYTVYFERNRVLHSVVDEAPPAPKS
ncbi:hypothetical protein [Dokdonella sp.]|uniref:hypothetical protein n=1 Tax=Dokdonella sp. TaxID=2291710 RepID=UPI002F40DA73